MNATDTTPTPTTIDESATVVVRREIRIEAPVDVVWRLHTDVAGWPAWQTDVDAVHVDAVHADAVHADGPLVPGASFRWSTHGLEVTSTVYAVDAPRRILWGGPAQGITGIHEWTFTPDGDATIVRTAESWEGDPVRADAENLRAALDASLGSWLALLRTKAEAKAAQRARKARRRRAAKALAWTSLGITGLFVLAEPWLLVPVLTFALALSLWD